jgi:hypothetical protein
MALDYGGPVAQLMHDLRGRFGLADFVETGTFEGTTAAWAARTFDRVTSIELSEELHRRACERHAGQPRIRFVQGHSREQLKSVVAGLEGPALFWLDGHYSGGETAGELDECPVLDEIAAIDDSEVEHFLFIDDARLFLCPPPAPHRAEQWPSLGELVTALQHRRGGGIVVLDDVIIRVPEHAKSFLSSRCQEIATQRATAPHHEPAPAQAQASGVTPRWLSRVAHLLRTAVGPSGGATSSRRSWPRR